MKHFLKAFLLIVAVVVVVVTSEECFDSVITACHSPRVTDFVECNPLLGGFKHVVPDLQSYVKSQLDLSYDYLLLATHFNSYQKNRPGFQKLFQNLSDKGWNKAIQLIQHITKRGGEMTFNQTIQSSKSDSEKRKSYLEADEVTALAMALDFEKELATRAQRIHRKVSLLDHHNHYYDPEIAQFIEEEFLQYQTNNIRTISGYVRDLTKLIIEAGYDPSLSIYLFDKYLQEKIGKQINKN